MRADAERNRRRLIEAATEMFGERGLEVGVAEIAQRAGVGRGTLFRNFSSKEALIAAVVVEMLRESTAHAWTMLDETDPAEAMFTLIEQWLARQQTNRALFEALDDEWMANPEILAAHHGMLEAVETLLHRAQRSGAVRSDISAVDLVLMIKGVCGTASSFQHIDPQIGMRQLDLMRAAITAPGAPARPLRGRPPAADALDRAVPYGSPAARAADLSLADHPGGD